MWLGESGGLNPGGWGRLEISETLGTRDVEWMWETLETEESRGSTLRQTGKLVETGAALADAAIQLRVLPELGEVA